ncbi:MAG: hypothetical protein V9G98_08700 [Candidatus Competibacter sp.]
MTAFPERCDGWLLSAYLTPPCRAAIPSSIIGKVEHRVDVYLFYDRMWKHLDRYPNGSPLEVGLENGLIVLYVSDEVTSFVDTLRVIQKRTAANLSEHAEQIANRLDAYMAARSMKPSFRVWSSQGTGSSGEQFLEVVKASFSGQAPEIFPIEEEQIKFNKLWKEGEIARWIDFMLIQGVQQTHDRGHKGVQRSVITNRIAEYYIGVKEVPHCGVILDSLQGDPRYIEVETFFKALTACYHYSQASYWQTNSSFPKLDPLIVELLCRVERESLVSATAASSDVCEMIQHPRLSDLAKLSPEAIRKIRLKGKDYFSAILAFDHAHDENAKVRLLEELSKYCAHVCREVAMVLGKNISLDQYLARCLPEGTPNGFRKLIGGAIAYGVKELADEFGLPDFLGWVAGSGLLTLEITTGRKSIPPDSSQIQFSRGAINFPAVSV